jgi:hypothetical protein
MTAEERAELTARAVALAQQMLYAQEADAAKERIR